MAASGLRADIAEKRLSMWLSENCGPDELLLPDEPPFPDKEGNKPPLPEQAARTKTAPAAHAVRVDLLMIERNDYLTMGRDESEQLQGGLVSGYALGPNPSVRTVAQGNKRGQTSLLPHGRR